MTNAVLNSRTMHSCNCIGPQRGEPLCPCRMRSVKVVDGRYVETIDHGPVREPVEPLKQFWGATE